MPPLAQIRAANKKYKPAARPVVLILGGTNGIGAGMARKIAELTAGNVYLIILGRNPTSANEVLASLPRTADSIYEFEKIDASYMKDVRRVTDKLNSKLEKVNFLVASSGYIDFKGVEVTEEGLDKKAAAAYYGRWRFILDLLPLVEKAAAMGERVGVETVFAAGKGTGVADFDKLNFTFDLRAGPQRMRTKGVAFTDAFLEALSKRHPNIPYVHTFPGFVATNFGPSWGTTLIRWFGFGSVSPEVCAEHEWYPLLSSDPAYRAGVFYIDEHADPTRRSEGITPEIIERIWEHTVKAIEI